MHGTRNDYHLVHHDDYILVDGQHEGIVSEELWEEAQVIREANAEKYKRHNRVENEMVHLLTGIVKCPVCGAGMYANKTTKRKSDGTFYKHFYYYGCKHRRSDRGYKCDYKKQINEELLDAAVIEAISTVVKNKKCADFMRSKIYSKVDVADLDAELEALNKQLLQLNSRRDIILGDIDNLDVEDRHYQRRKTDLENSLYKVYDKIDDIESLIIDARAKKKTLIADKMSTDNIYKSIIYMDKFFEKMNPEERREFIEQLISEVNVYEERTTEGQWLKSIKFRLPLLEKNMEISLDNGTHTETVVLLSKDEIPGKR